MLIKLIKKIFNRQKETEAERRLFGYLMLDALTKKNEREEVWVRWLKLQLEERAMESERIRRMLQINPGSSLN